MLYRKEKVTIEIFDIVGNKVTEMNSLKAMNGTNMIVDISKQSFRYVFLPHHQWFRNYKPG